VEPVITPPAVESISTPVPETIPSTPTSPTHKKTKSTINLQSLLSNKGVEAEVKSKPESSEKLKTRKLTLAEVQTAWNQYAESRKHQVAEYNVLLKEFTLEGNSILLQLANPVEEPLLADMKMNILTFLREKLDCEISLESVMLKSASKKVIYTNKEKFDHLAGKNPALHELKERLGLDTDY
jgi:DNA polymerase III subunit gamma/tau